MEKITLENLLMWDDEEMSAAVEELETTMADEFAAHFDFDVRDVFEDSSFTLPWDIELYGALKEASSNLQETFEHAFVHYLGFDPQDWESSDPVAYPWIYGDDLEGETVEEMAKNHAEKCRESILKLLAIWDKEAKREAAFLEDEE